ncbi:uncharacterized protein HD556DRAFT_1328030 [Suillus plorans]|uniref:Rho1 guanine nucleotide exchange factor 1 n=1 Tax=Suillus plorans TaxID=116603 RepID=A0A9P7DX39_9AGAM|nr:uncharacterized protein HD556DRAFT_1328030 [Suillus plorans]KAG1805037.1 hypothetical protein HD556DRAFT_1328030 [Suillus plorans]
MHNQRHYPYVTIPPGASPLPNPSPLQAYPDEFEHNAPSGDLLNPWDQTPTTRHPNGRPGELRSRPRTRSAYEPLPPTISFPEPEIHRFASQRTTLHPYSPRHRPSKSDDGHDSLPPSGDHSTRPFTPVTPDSASSMHYPPEDDWEAPVNQLTQELSNVSLYSEEGLRLFQAGHQLAEKDEEWHRLVPPEAQEALGKKEVERQSVLFELFKSERDYVEDLRLVTEVFIEPLQFAKPPVIASDRLRPFVQEVFWNLGQIFVHHERMLAALFERQLDQHPLVQSVTDIVLETCFQFQADYESYIKHYPIAEERHRTELSRNKNYQVFIQKCSQDPRMRKRDMITFLSRPVTRLPRLHLILEHIQKITEPGHPDLEDLPLLLNILSDFLKSTQPGIAAAENRVKYWNVCESLTMPKGQIMDLDWYDDSRSLVYSGPVARRSKSEMDWHPWTDLFAVLLDNYLLLTKEERRTGGILKRYVSSRPIPLEYLKLGSFEGQPESRRERSEEGGILDSLRAQYKPIYPFTIYHSADKLERRYTLYAPTESAREKWRNALVETKGIDDVRRDANKWFAPQLVDDGSFRSPGAYTPRGFGSKASGRVVNAVSFTAAGGKRLMAVGCATGIYVGLRGDISFRKILSYGNPSSIIVLQEFNKFIVHHESYLLSYSLDILARVAMYQAPASSLDASMEKIAGEDGTVLFCTVGRIKQRMIVIYALKSFFQITVHALEACNLSELRRTPSRGSQGTVSSFRPFGEPLYVPKDAYSVMALAKMIAISTEKGIVIADPTDATRQIIQVVPDFSGATCDSTDMADLKTRCEDAKPLGLIRTETREILVVYDTLGCYITKQGVPHRKCGFILWETKATSFAHRGSHVMLFSSEFIEIRSISTGRLDQVIEGSDIRLLMHTNLKSHSADDPLLVAMRGTKDDKDGVSDKIIELVRTGDFNSTQTPMTPTPVEGLWDEWDM